MSAKDPKHRKIAVLGGGSWGTALATQVARAHHDVTLWDMNPEHVQSMQQSRINQQYLPDIPLPESLKFSDQLEQTICESNTLLIAIPSHAVRGFLLKTRQWIRADHHIVWATKGLEEGSGKPVHQIVAEELPECKSTAVVSGPTFAAEVAKNLPTAVTVAASSHAIAEEVASFLHYGNFRVYTSEDMTGVELGGSLKNVLAIAAGIADGLGFGSNTRAALITRGLNEIMRLGLAMGAQAETFMGLAGMGDLVLTCTDNQSRNRRMGLALAEGLSIEQARERIGQAVEGVKTAKEAWLLAQKYKVEMPIIEQAYKVLYENKSPKDAVQDLLGREAKSE
jgi:glycerol-3-phosphate dehydrogenase (NAD(P)+)